MSDLTNPPDLIAAALADYADKRVGPNVRTLLICVEEAAEIAPLLRGLAEQIDDLMARIKNTSFALACLVRAREEALGEPSSLEDVWNEIRARLEQEHRVVVGDGKMIIDGEIIVISGGEDD